MSQYDIPTIDWFEIADVILQLLLFKLSHKNFTLFSLNPYLAT